MVADEIGSEADIFLCSHEIIGFCQNNLAHCQLQTIFWAYKKDKCTNRNYRKTRKAPQIRLFFKVTKAPKEKVF